MEYLSTFVLNLSRQRISLGLVSKNQRQQILDGFDPNEPAGSQSLKKLFYLAKALNGNDPIVEVFLPNDIIQYETFIPESAPTPEGIKRVIAERKRLSTSDIQVALGENVGSRAISIAFVETSVIEELRNFITQAGFKIKCFRAGKHIAGFNKNQELFTEYNHQQKNKIASHINFKYTSLAVFFVLGLFLLLNWGTNLYRDLNEIKLPPPIVTTDLALNNSLWRILDTDSTRKIESNSDFSVLKGPKKELHFSSQALETIQDFNVNKEIPSNILEQLLPIRVYRPNIWLKLHDLRSVQITDTKFSESNVKHSQFQLEKITTILRGQQPEFEIVNLMEPSSGEELILIKQRKAAEEIQKQSIITVPKNDDSSNQANQNFARLAPLSERVGNPIQQNDSGELITPNQKKTKEEINTNGATNQPQSENLSRKTNQTFTGSGTLSEDGETVTSSSQESGISSEEPAIRTGQEHFPELEPIAMEYALKLTPYKRPLVIDSIRILPEPTLSSGALVFLQMPLMRPEQITKSKRIKSSTISITARATRSPSIPKEASVGHNSTKRNFIDLDRTNLIGIFGKTSNPKALVRLSNGKIITLKVGDGFQGWRVFAIDRDKIHVENGSRQEILRLPG